MKLRLTFTMILMNLLSSAAFATVELGNLGRGLEQIFESKAGQCVIKLFEKADEDPSLAARLEKAVEGLGEGELRCAELDQAGKISDKEAISCLKKSMIDDTRKLLKKAKLEHLTKKGQICEGV